MNTNAFVGNAVIALDCPACDGTILVDQVELEGEVRCDSCLVAFSIAEPVGELRGAVLEPLAA